MSYKQGTNPTVILPTLGLDESIETIVSLFPDTLYTVSVATIAGTGATQEISDAVETQCQTRMYSGMVMVSTIISSVPNCWVF